MFVYSEERKLLLSGDIELNPGPPEILFLLKKKSLTLCTCTRSCARADDAEIVRNRDAQCNAKAPANDRNMPTQHIATLLGATCCVRMATLLRHVATCWVLLAQV